MCWFVHVTPRLASGADPLAVLAALVTPVRLSALTSPTCSLSPHARGPFSPKPDCSFFASDYSRRAAAGAHSSSSLRLRRCFLRRFDERAFFTWAPFIIPRRQHHIAPLSPPALPAPAPAPAPALAPVVSLIEASTLRPLHAPSIVLPPTTPLHNTLPAALFSPVAHTSTISLRLPAVYNATIEQVLTTSLNLFAGL
jgi:hypothetical protein